VYHFAIIALLALATVKVVDVLTDNVGALARYRSLLAFAIALGGVWALDYSLFAGFGIAVRDAAIGTWATGFLVAGMTVPWRAAFAWLTHAKAVGDETLGDHAPMRRVA
jgi:hypothetical protein